MSSRESKVNLHFCTPREREILKLIAEGYKDIRIKRLQMNFILV